MAFPFEVLPQAAVAAHPVESNLTRAHRPLGVEDGIGQEEVRTRRSVVELRQKQEGEAHKHRRLGTEGVHTGRCFATVAVVHTVQVLAKAEGHIVHSGPEVAHTLHYAA